MKLNVPHCSPYGISVATGEMCANRVMFKQFLQANALQYCQIDSCRIGGVNEILSVYFMAKKLNGSSIASHHETYPEKVLTKTFSQ